MSLSVLPRPEMLEIDVELKRSGGTGEFWFEGRDSFWVGGAKSSAPNRSFPGDCGGTVLF